jgi:Nif-specific regulatory protein
MNAEGGTIFLDEIGELAPATQAKLLRVLQFREFERLGSTEVQETDIRIITATNRDIEEAVLAGTFRQDFYYRLNVFTIHLPELRERRSDIPALAEHFAALYAKRHKGSSVSLSEEAVDALMAHDFPGNVRELENIIERAVVSADGPCVLVRDLPPALRGLSQKPREAPTLAASVGQLECQLIEQALRETRGNAARAARSLGTTERIVRYKAAKYGIDSSRFRGSSH